MISPVLQALTAHQQFIVYRIEPSKTRPGKTDKIPCDYRTGGNANAHDPACWTDTTTAIAAAATRGEGYGIGFVLTAECKRFCLDIDNCLQPNGKWSQLAFDLYAMFSGAAIEISQSGRG
jgi:primase-polymerase (primpol)-like protein